MTLGPNLANQSIASQADVADIKTITDQLLVFSSTEGTLTADGTEQDIYFDDTPAGIVNPRVVYIDLDNMAGGDTTVINVYYRVIAAGAQQLIDTTSYVGADGGLAGGRKIIAIDLTPYRNGAQVTLTQSAGVNRDYPWNVIIEN